MTREPYQAEPGRTPSRCGVSWDEHPSANGEPYCEPSSCPARPGRDRRLPMPESREPYRAEPGRGCSDSRDINGHRLEDISPDDGGRWWWLCACDSAEGGHSTEHAAHRAWSEHAETAPAKATSAKPGSGPHTDPRTTEKYLSTQPGSGAPDA